jgi:8-oxo-dGTP pyrophosphatase MutT (NUDIX family)
MKSRKYVRDGREWEMPDAFYRFSVKLIIKNDDDKLLVLKDLTTDTWELPGGGLDHGETIEQTAEREIQEELGVELTMSDTLPIIIEPGLHPDNYPTVKVYYRATLSGYDFVLEAKFEYKFVGKAEFLSLEMPGDESPIQKHAPTIWPEK